MKKKCNINEFGHSRTAAPAQEAPYPITFGTCHGQSQQLRIDRDAIACGFIPSGV
jgi:hypothetical protein